MSHRTIIALALMTAVGIVGVAVSAYLVEVVGRKWVIGISGPLAGAALVLFAVMLDVGSGVLVWLAVFGFVIQIAIPVTVVTGLLVLIILWFVVRSACFLSMSVLP